MAAFVGMDVTTEQSLTTFPGIRAARTVENTLYLGVLLFWALHCLALHRAFAGRGGPRRCSGPS